MTCRFVGHTALGVLILALAPRAGAQERFYDPNPAIVRILDAVPASGVVVSPDRGKLLILEPSARPSVAGTVAPELRLAGERINPRINAQSRFQTYSALIVQPIGRGDIRRIVVPWAARITNPMWSPDGVRVAYTLLEDAGVSLWVAEAATGESRMLYGPLLNGSFGNPCQWLPSGSALLCARIPLDRAAAPAASAPGTARPAANPSSQDLLQNPTDEVLFERYFADQLVLIPLSGADRSVGPQGLHQDVQISPDGRYLLVETLHRPFSYAVPASRFPARTEVWELSTGSVVKTLGDRGLSEATPLAADAVPAGPRAISWRNDVPASVAWAEAVDGGDPAVVTKVRDRVFLLDAPFTGAPAKLLDLEFRSSGVTWARPTLALVSETWSSPARARNWVINPSRLTIKPRLLFERRSADRGSEPGQFVTRPGVGGAPVLMTSKDGRFAYVIGAEAAGAFVDRLDLTTGKSLRLIRSEPPSPEQAVTVVDPDLGRLIMRRESPNALPTYVIRDLRARASTKKR